MILIPGQLIALLTFPGVIVHELSHLLFCKIFNVKVKDVCFFRMDKTPGYVTHEGSTNPWTVLCISIGPLLVNTIIGGIIGLSAAVPAYEFGNFRFNDVVVLWAGISIAMHAFPSQTDAYSLRQFAKSNSVSSVIKFLFIPVSYILQTGSALSVLWLDFIYGIFVVYGASKLFLRAVL
jgi:type III secretory pathway component EscS